MNTIAPQSLYNGGTLTDYLSKGLCSASYVFYCIEYATVKSWMDANPNDGLFFAFYT
jgi:hypothetical protein